MLVLRWFLDDTRMTQLARDNAISTSTAYSYRDEGTKVLAPRRPALHGVPLAAKATGHSHVNRGRHTDLHRPPTTRPAQPRRSSRGGRASTNTTAATSRSSPPPTGGLWTSDVRPGREHDTTAACADPDLLTLITTWVGDGHPSLADLGYEGEPDIFTIPIKKPKSQNLTVDQQTYNAVHGALRCLGERANSLIKTTYKALRRYRGCPWRLGGIVAAALVLLHHENNQCWRGV